MTTKELVTNYTNTINKNAEYISKRQERRKNRRTRQAKEQKAREQVISGVAVVLLAGLIFALVFFYALFLW